MGGKRITGVLSEDYRLFLIEALAHGQKGNADLCSYFFLRAHQLLGLQKRFGLLATNTIAQGDTREVGMDQLVASGAVIDRAWSSRPWPGVANLYVAVVWIHKGKWNGLAELDEKPADGITAFLLPAAKEERKPFRLAQNEGIAFQGSNIRGRGFILTSEQREQMLSANPKNQAVISPYLTGEDLNTRPDQSPGRFVINFYDWEREQAEQYHEPFELVRRTVLPEREKITHAASREKCVKYFWRYDALAKGLYAAISGLNEVLLTARVSPSCAIATSKTGCVFYETLIVFVLPIHWGFALLQSSIHWEWVRKYTGTFGATTLRYTASDCFDTFPLPPRQSELGQVGQRYLRERTRSFQASGMGLTEGYNRFHDRGEQSADIARLRALHVEMDQAVAAAYGWSDLDLGHGFHATKQGERYTLSESARRTVLDRLLALNHQRHAEELAAGLHEKGSKKGTKPRSHNSAAAPPMGLVAAPQADLFG